MKESLITILFTEIWKNLFFWIQYQRSHFSLLHRQNLLIKKIQINATKIDNISWQNLPPLNSERLVIPVFLRPKNVNVGINSSLRHRRQRDLGEISFLDLIDDSALVDNGSSGDSICDDVKIVCGASAGGAQDRMVRDGRTQGKNGAR